MKKLIFFYIALCLFPTWLWAACGGSSPQWIAADASYSEVSACVSVASAGDTISISGNATWTGNTLALTRGINVIGSGNPVITSKGIAIYWTPSESAQAAHDTLKISGIIFDADNASSDDVSSSGIIRINNSSPTNHVNLIFNSNTIKNATKSVRGLYLHGPIYGVAYNNIFDRLPIILTTGWSDYNSWNNYNQLYGSSNTFFLEDNTIQYSESYTSSGYAGWIESGNGAWIVVRYNTWDDTNLVDSKEYWDSHGLQSPTSPEPDQDGQCQQYSTMVAEYYGNKIIDATDANRWMYHRGGWLLMYFNSLDANNTPTGIRHTQYACNECASVGSYNQKVENTYEWSNLINGSNTIGEVASPGSQPYGCVSDPIIENEDFWNYKSDFSDNSTRGMGCGTLANRPATCTTGVGYWATDQSCSDLTGMVGSNPTTPISGTLYKCTDTNTWTAYYTPYTYPHPLRSQHGRFSGSGSFNVR